MWRLLLLLGMWWCAATVVGGQVLDNTYVLQVCPVTSADPPQDVGACLAPDCFRYYYEVYLLLNDPNLNGIEFEELSVTADLVVEGELTQLNASATVACTPANFADYLAGVEPLQAAFYMPDEAGTYAFPGPSLHLFTLVVDAFPGEEISLEISGTIGKGMNEQYELLIGPCTQLTLTWPSAPSCGEESLSLVLLEGGSEEPATVAVSLEGWDGAFVEEFDVAIDVTSAELMEMPWIEGGQIAAQDVEVRPRAGGGYVVYAHVRGVQWSSGTALFYIHLDGPSFLSLGGTITLSFRDGRYAGAGTDCCQPQLGSALDVVFAGYPPCSEGMWFELSASEQDPDLCDILWVDFFVNWTGLDSAVQVYKLNVVVEVDLEGDIAFSGMVANSLPCPSGQYYCGGADCFEQLDAETFRYCFWSPVGEWLDSGRGFRLGFTAPAGCIASVRFREAYVDLVGGNAYVACVPERKVTESDFPLCSPYVSGRVLRENGALVEGNWRMRYNSSDGANAQSVQTCTELYARCLGKEAATWTVAPHKNDEWLCGVTTYDLVLIQRHILQVQPLDSPYKLIAADANNDGLVTTFDVAKLRKLILHMIEELPENTSWRFVDASYVFPDPANPWSVSFPESVEVTQLPAQDVDFVAVKVGDVNLSCDAGCAPLAGAGMDRSAEGRWAVGVPEISLRAGEVAVVPLYWSGADSCVAFQMGLRWDAAALEVLGWVQGDLSGLSEQSFHFGADHLRMLWLVPGGGVEAAEWLQPGRRLYGLQVRARRDLPDLRAHLEMDDSLLPNLGWTATGQAHGLRLRAWDQAAREAESPFEVRVWPNPIAEGELQLRVRSQVATRGRLLLFDASGRLLHHQSVELERGRQRFSVPAREWPQGVVIWRLVTRAGSASGYVLTR